VAYQNKREYGRAIADYTEAIRLDRLSKVVYRYAETVTTYNNLAWLLAVCPHAEYRDGHRAVEHATHACNLSGWGNPYCLGTLAAAYAEAGEFARAIKWQTKAIEIATPDYDVPAAESHLKLYKTGKVYREE
jgi:tetratricopeptide (TPR) repeat protein